MQSLSAEEIVIIKEIVAKHVGSPGSAIPILQEIQKELGYVSTAFLRQVAELTETPASDLYSIVTFYSQFRLEPLGKNYIQVCHGTACHLAGAERITDSLEHETKTKCGCTSENGEFTLEKVACVGCCSLAPVVNVNGETHGRLTPEKTAKVIENLRNKGNEGNGDVLR